MSHRAPLVDVGCLLMNTLPPDLAKRLLSRDLANLAQRIHNGGKLNPSEKAMLEGIGDSPGFSSKIAENFVALAGILGVTRRSLQRWRKRRDAPKPMNSGFHDVSAWQEFMRRHGLKGEAALTEEEIALRLRKLRAEVEEREMRLSALKSRYVSRKEVRAAWTSMSGRAAGLFRQKFEEELPPVLSGLDATGIQEECCRAIDAVLTILHTSDG